MRWRRSTLPNSVILRSFYSALFSFLLFSYSVQAQSSKVLFVTENLEPMQFLKDQKINGLAVDIVRGIAAEANIGYQMSLLSWSRAYQLTLSSRNTCIFTMTRLPVRESKFHWIGVISSFKAQFMIKKDRQHLDIDSLDDAKKHGVLAISQDWVHHHLVDKGFITGSNIIVAPSREKMLNLAYGKDQYYLIFYDPRFLRFWAKNNGKDPERFVPINIVEPKQRDLYLACSLKTAPSILEGLGKGLVRFKDSDKYQQLLEDWDF